MREEDLDVLCVGENHALYAHEAMRVTRWPRTSSRAEACRWRRALHNLFNKYMSEHPIDFVVCAEGEYTLGTWSRRSVRSIRTTARCAGLSIARVKVPMLSRSRPSSPSHRGPR